MFTEAFQLFAVVGQVAILTTNSSPGKAEPSQTQRWAKVAATNHIAADMLRHFVGKDPSWADLYKAYEGARKLAGKKALVSFPSESDLRRFSHTANCYRHNASHSANQNPPENPMSLHEAVAMIRGMINSVMAELS
jgi:hypothetical protein